MNPEPGGKTNGIVNGVESCGEIEKTQTGYFMRAYSINQMIVCV